jgi:hypothetical protein
MVSITSRLDASPSRCREIAPVNPDLGQLADVRTLLGLKLG